MPRVQPDVDAFMAQFDHLPGMGRDPASILRRVELMEYLLEQVFVLPGTRRRVGLDAIIGLIPVIGDVITGAMGAWIVWEARNLGMSKWQLARMVANIGIDTVLGSVPIIGDAFDLVFRSNSRNLMIIRRHVERHYPGAQIIEG